MTSPATIIHNLESQGIRLSLVGDKIKLISDQRPDDQTIAEVKSNKTELILFLSKADRDERAAIAEFDGGLPREWAAAFAKLQVMDRPEQYSQAGWEQVLNDAGLFADRWAHQAIALGWTVLDVFSVHKSGNRKRLDGEGVVLSIRGRKVVAITADHIMIETGAGARLRIAKPPADKKSIKTMVQI